MSRIVVGLFDERDQAEAAVRALVDEGYPRDQLSIVTRGPGDADARAEAPDRDATHGNQAGKGAGIGAGAGAVLGGVGGFLVGIGLLFIPGLGPLVAAGPIAATLAGAGAGAVAGGLLGALVGMGIPREEAEVYAEGVRRGGTLLALTTAEDRADHAADIMRRNGAVDIKERESQWREQGWRGYDPKAAPLSEEEAARERARHRAPVAPQPAVAQQAVLDRPQPSHAPAAPPEFDAFDSLFRRDFETTIAYQGMDYQRSVPAYRYGYLLATDPAYQGRDWDALEGDARSYWEERNPGTWDQFQRAIRYAWESVRARM